MATKTKFIFPGEWFYDGTSRVNSGQSRQGTGSVGRRCRRSLRRMRIMTIGAGHVPGWIHDLFRRIVNAAARQDWMRAQFFEFSFDIFLRHIPVVTRKAVVFFFRKSEKSRANASAVS